MADDFYQPPFQRSALLAADTLLHTGKAYIDKIECLVAGATNNGIVVRDGLTDTGTVVASFTPSSVKTYPVEAVVSTGIFIEINGTTPAQCIVYYKPIA